MIANNYYIEIFSKFWVCINLVEKITKLSINWEQFMMQFRQGRSQDLVIGGGQNGSLGGASLKKF